jgi:hypothetical protein
VWRVPVVVLEDAQDMLELFSAHDQEPLEAARDRHHHRHLLRTDDPRMETSLRTHARPRMSFSASITSN